MGAIKDLVDLISQLTNSVQDRKFAAELRQIQGMIGGIQSEQAALHEQRIELMTENAELKQTIASLQQQITNLKTPQPRPMDELDEEPKRILMFLVRAKDVRAEQVAHSTQMDLVRAEYWLGVLTKSKLIYRALFMGSPSTYSLSQNGREYLITRGMI